MRMVLISLSRVFNKLCAKVVDPQNMQVLKSEALETMSTIKHVIPPTCFDVMTHLIIHLVEELDLCGPVHTRWMYPIERYMKALKGYVRNMAWLEGSMTTWYTFVKWRPQGRVFGMTKKNLQCMMKCLKGMAMLINWVPTLKIGPTHLLSTMHQQQTHGVSKNAGPKHMIMTTMYIKSSFC